MLVIVYFKGGRIETFEDIQGVEWGEYDLKLTTAKWSGAGFELTEDRIAPNDVAKVEMIRG